ncbi:MAG: hypothetical protein P4L84_37355 [Isosphaeraceae bacterium]|nr:hypothetical protein [Isosphaeraceae bacterium]
MSFRLEDLEREEAPLLSHQGLRGWVERWTNHYKTSWRTAEGPLIRGLRGIWEWLHRRTYDDEPLLSHLRSAAGVEIAHPQSLASDDAVKLWKVYLSSRQWRHGLWFALNVVVSPITVILAPLPGPNLIGYWFIYRAFHHGLILVGLRKVQRGYVQATFHSAEACASEPATVDDEPGNGPGLCARA